jgi:hypothetical protein
MMDDQLESAFRNSNKSTESEGLIGKQLLMLSQIDDFAFEKTTFPHLFKYIINWLGINTAYEDMIAAFANEINQSVQSDNVIRVLLTLRLIRVSNGISLMGIKRPRFNNQADAITIHLRSVAQKVAEIDLARSDIFARRFIKSIDALVKYNDFLRDKSIDAKRWTDSDWIYGATMDAETITLWLAAYQLLTSSGFDCPLEWHEEFRLNYASMNRAAHELMMWKKDIMENTPTMLRSAVMCSLGNNSDLEQMARFIYLSSEGEWLAKEITSKIPYIKEYSSGWMGRLNDFMLMEFVQVAETAVIRFYDIRKMLQPK